MTTMTQDQAWLDANRRRLSSELERVRAILEHHRNGPTSPEARAAQAQTPEVEETPLPASAIDVICTLFQLSPFERDILLVCAGVELESGFAALCAAAQSDVRKLYPTFSLALAAIPGGHWSALSPQAPLRYWRLIEVRELDTLVTSRLVIDERVLHFLVGVDAVDIRLDALLKDLITVDPLSPSQMGQVDRLRSIWESNTQAPPVIQIVGDDARGAKAVAARACADLGLQTMALRAQDLSPVASEREASTRLLTREALLRRSAIVVDVAQGGGALLSAIVDTVECPMIVVGDESFQTTRPRAVLEVGRPLPAEQRALWRSALGDGADMPDVDLERLTTHFHLTSGEIADAAREARSSVLAGAPPASAVWTACRVRARGGLEQMAQRIWSDASWDDLVLPASQTQLLREMARQVGNRATVHERWQFTSGGMRGFGVSALFAGESGTGKTLAAEVLANELELDLYRIDLSSVVSKYIGDTEKNLKSVFDAAQASGSILLFDEADALFGKRSDVKDSHDRYANIEVGYLLQRIESYRGLAILTTNMKGLLDTAFLRRIRFVVQFPFPDAPLRGQIWQRVFPAAMPIDGVNFDQLARLNVAGGNIKNIALNAAFLAAADGMPLAMSHLLHATQVECAKLEKPLTEAEIGGWR